MTHNTPIKILEGIHPIYRPVVDAYRRRISAIVLELWSAELLERRGIVTDHGDLAPRILPDETLSGHSGGQLSH